MGYVWCDEAGAEDPGLLPEMTRDEELERWARRLIESADTSTRGRGGGVTVDGEVLELLHKALKPPGLQRPAAYRQSLIAAFDSCPLRARFTLEDNRRTPSMLAARGTLFHHFVHKAARMMWRSGEQTMPVDVGLELLVGVVAQMDLPSDEVVPITMSEMRWVRVMVTKWCEATQLDATRILDVEKRFSAPLTLPSGEVVTITGQLDLLLNDPPDGAIVVDYKAQPVDAKVLTPSGWRQIGDLRVGDKVIGSNGMPTRVTGVYPQGQKDVYEVELTDGSKTRCCNEHLWGVRHPGQTKLFVRSLAEIRASAPLMWQVPAVQPVLFSDALDDLPVDPYLLGALLGDGNLRTTSSIRFTSADTEVLEGVGAALPSGVHMQKAGDRYDWTIISSYGRGQPSHDNTLRIGLRRLGLLGKLSWEKFVPREYLLASPEARLALLQGLMDTDGHISEGNRIGYRSSSKQLAYDVMFLVRSLGGRAALATWTSRLGAVQHRECYSVQFRLPAVPFRLSRKAERWRPSKLSAGRIVRSITSAGTSECVCIRVAASDGLYVTDDFILTHNSGFRKPSNPRDPEKAEHEGSGLTALGWVQWNIYCFLVFANFPSVNRVIFRERHVLWNLERQARMERWQSEKMQDILAQQVSLLHQAIDEGPTSDRWVPSAGTHCAMCSNPRGCPIMDDEQIDITTVLGRRRVAQEWRVAGETKDRRRVLLDGLIDRYGPIEIPHADGRRVVGYAEPVGGVTENAAGRVYTPKRFGIFEPRDVPESPYDEVLFEAARERGLAE